MSGAAFLSPSLWNKQGPPEPVSGPAAPGPTRNATLDIARGLAIMAMVAFHAQWDAAALGLFHPDAATAVVIAWAGHAIAGGFLFISGIGLVLAHGRGARAAARRLAVLALAAGAVTLATWLWQPEDAIVFGILHCLLVTNLLALTLVGAPPVLIIVAAGLSLAAPLVFRSEALTGWGWWWLGLSARLPRTLDYRPVLPWLGIVLLGVLAGRLLAFPARPAPAQVLPRLLALAGRRSLAIYLIHQPIVFALVFVLARAVAGPGASPAAGSFGSACISACRSAGTDAQRCAAACRCVEDALGQAGQTPAALPADRLAPLASACLRRSEPAAPPAGG